MKPRQIELTDVDCTLEKDENEESVRCSMFTIEFTDMTAAEEALSSIRSMQESLYIEYLCSVRYGEIVSTARGIADFAITSTHFHDPYLEIIGDGGSTIDRLIIRSGDFMLFTCIPGK